MKKGIGYEKKLAKDFKGKRNKASGSLWYLPSDIKTDKWLIEAKETNKKSYSISLKVLRKIYDEAIFSYRLPLMAIKIQNTRIVILFKEDFINLIKNL